MIGEVIGLFLRNTLNEINGGRVLEQGYMMTLHGLIATKLDRKKLDKEMTFIQHGDSAGILLNEVNHIYAQISVSRERSSNNDKVPKGINDVIDEIMEYKTAISVKFWSPILMIMCLVTRTASMMMGRTTRRRK